MITIDTTRPIVTVINHCTVRPESQDDLVDAWLGCMDGIRSFPGFLAAAVHRSDDGTKVTTYLQWESREGHEQCLAHTDWSGDAESRFRALLDSGIATIDPEIYTVVGTFEGPVSDG